MLIRALPDKMEERLYLSRPMRTAYRSGWSLQDDGTEKYVANFLSGVPTMPNAKPSRKESADLVKLGDFPALRQFMHGYLHEDFLEEYGSAEEAAAEFCQDADPEEREQVADEWRRFLKATSEMPVSAVRKLMSEKFGSAWHFDERDELDRFSSTLLKKHTH